MLAELLARRCNLEVGNDGSSSADRHRSRHPSVGSAKGPGKGSEALLRDAFGSLLILDLLQISIDHFVDQIVEFGPVAPA
jgi:hypothetical protein